MKKLFLTGRSEAGKTSLTQALKGETLHYVKTQYTNTSEDTIDSPGEYAESKHFSAGHTSLPGTRRRVIRRRFPFKCS